MKHVVFLDEAEEADVSRLGGKGANLVRCLAAGFPVPPAFVITSAAYERLLAGEAAVQAALADLDEAEDLGAACRRIREGVLAARLPAGVRREVREALARLAPEGAAVAVRSSSTLEDLAQAAFAGQHDTFLNCRGLGAVLDAVRACQASLWSERAALYRRRRGLLHADALMAVVVQRQVDCDAAGVAFSIQPVSGRFDRLAIDGNHGLGESVVAGACAVDHFELDKADLAVVERAVARKTVAVVPAAAGVEERPLDEARAAAPCLSDDQLRAVGALATRAESHFGWPQDVEWGFAEGMLHLFQARPVTTIQPCWTRDESAERFPNPMTPLSWDFISAAFSRSLAHSLALMGLPPFTGEWFRTFDHYVYGDQNAVALLSSYRPVRARSLEELAAEVPALAHRHAWMLDLPITWTRDLDRYLVGLGRLSSVRLQGASLGQAWRHLLDVFEVAADYFRPNIAISMTQAVLHRALHGLVALAVGPERARLLMDGLLAGGETKTALVNAELFALAREARGRGALEAALRAGDTAAVLAALPGCPDWAARFRRFLSDHGHREVDMDYAQPTWGEAPTLALGAVALVLRGGREEDPAQAAQSRRQRAFETEQAVLRAVPEGLRFFFRELIRLARTYTVLDDLEHYETTRANPVARRAALVLGARLQEAGALEAREDVFLLRREDLEACVASRGRRPREYRARAAATRRSLEAARRSVPPWRREDGAASVPEPATNLLRGLPGSPGRARGRAVVVRDASDFEHFPPGAILVARTTNPAWTPLFYSAAGLVAESGGPLSHGAVTAREMRLPAVMAVRDALTRLRDGLLVEIDGGRGTVTIEGD